MQTFQIKVQFADQSKLHVRVVKTKSLTNVLLFLKKRIRDSYSNAYCRYSIWNITDPLHPKKASQGYLNCHRA